VATRWWEPALELIERAEPSWSGLWSILTAADHAAMTLSLRAPLGKGVDLAFAAVELGEAREELEWVRDGLRELAGQARLGPLALGDDATEARHLLGRLIDAATNLVLVLAEGTTAVDEVDALGRVLRSLRTAGEELARAAG